MTEIRILRRDDEAVLANIAPEVFDVSLDENLTAEFLDDDRHHLAVAIEAGRVVGMASAVHYVHPDKPAQLFINEVGVTPSHRGRGIGKALKSELFNLGASLGCSEAWVLTNRSNSAAMQLCSSMGGSESSEDQVMFTFRLAEDDLE